MRLRATILTALLVATGSAASADWLVMRDGSQIETRGPWKKKGAQIIFTSMKGVLSSVRASEVDLDASASATVAARNEAVEQEPPPAEDPRSAAVVITDKDVPAYDGPPPEVVESPGEEEGEEGEQTQPAAPAADAGINLEVVSWRHVESEQVEGIEIFGSIRNTGSDIATNVGVLVNLLDEDGNPLAKTNAFLRTPAVPPGRTVTFRAPFPGIYRVYGEPEFELTARGLKLQMTEKKKDEEED